MDMFIPPTPVSGSFGVGADYKPSITAEKDQASQFASVFLQNMLREIFKKQWKNELTDDNSSSDGIYNEMLTDEIISQLAADDAFGLNEMIMSGIAKKDAEAKKTE